MVIGAIQANAQSRSKGIYRSDNIYKAMSFIMQSELYENGTQCVPNLKLAHTVWRNQRILSRSFTCLHHHDCFEEESMQDGLSSGQKS